MQGDRWVFGDVAARNVGGALVLSHLFESAELVIRHGRLTRGRGYREASGPARRALARVGGIVRLRGVGRFHFHAAGAVSPAGVAVLLTGDSGSGKSTLAYALARRGWRVLGDDGVILELTPGGLVVHPWREALRVSSDMRAVFPELSFHEADPGDRDPRRRMAIETARSRQVPLGAVLRVRRAGRFAAVPLAPAATLAELVRQSPWVMLGDAAASAHLATLLAVVERVPRWHIDHTSAELGRFDRVVEEVLA